MSRRSNRAILVVWAWASASGPTGLLAANAKTDARAKDVGTDEAPRVGAATRGKVQRQAAPGGASAQTAVAADPRRFAAFKRGVRSFHSGDYPEAEAALAEALAGHSPVGGGERGPTSTAGASLLNVDWATYLLGESAFFAGHLDRARAAFETATRQKSPRFSAIAAARVADVLWMQGDHAGAVARYRRLPPVTPSTARERDPAVAAFRIAQLAEEQKATNAAALFTAFYRNFPGHPWAAEAQRRIGEVAAGSTTQPAPSPSALLPPAPAPASRTASASPEPPPHAGGVSPEDRLHRAEVLSRERSWDAALDELARLPASLPAPLAAERDYQIGMTKFHMRRDYAKAAALLLGVAPSFTGDKAAAALFHGSRALSRIDRDDEAIAGYKQVVARFGGSRFAAEAQFLSAWLDYNRGRYRESLPGLRATLDHFGGSPFADDAAWCVAFASYLLGEFPEASTALDRYARLPPTGMTGDERSARVAYWRARIADAMARRLGTSGETASADEASSATSGGKAVGAAAGKATADLSGATTARSTFAGQTALREISRRWPFSFYGVAARARLAELGDRTAIELRPPPQPADSFADARGASSGTVASTGRESPAARATLARVDELAASGLDVEAGWELERAESGLLGRDAGGGGRVETKRKGARPDGREIGLTREVLRRYEALQNFHRPYELAELRHGDALAGAATGSARLWWEAAYPRAYRELVERYGPRGGNPDVLLYAIMRKESGYSPWDVSVADARGLLQMIPPTSAQVARDAGLDFAADELFQPDINIRLGALYIGGLAKKFRGQIPLVAGAYNAGPKAMAKWCEQHAGHATDEFVELIAFTQTREYAKRVVGIYARYRHLYGPSEYEMPLAVDAKPDRGGPDY